MEGLRNIIIKVDKHRAPDVGHLNGGTKSSEVRGPKLEEEYSEVSTRKGPEKWTPRTEEVASRKACINVRHIAEDRWGPPLVDADWHAFCRAIYKGVEGSGWVNMYDYHEEMSKAAGIQKPHSSQKARALWRDEGGER